MTILFDKFIINSSIRVKNKKMIDNQKVLARIKGEDAKKLLQELENDACIRFHLTTTDKNNNNNNYEPVIELYTY
jgi:hypothetical protein